MYRYMVYVLVVQVLYMCMYVLHVHVHVHDMLIMFGMLMIHNECVHRYMCMYKSMCCKNVLLVHFLEILCQGI